MRIFLLLAFLSISYHYTLGQITQNVRGTVSDVETQVRLDGAKVRIYTSDTTKLYYAVADEEGQFEITEVPIGKHQLIVTYFGYEPKAQTIEVNSGRETIVSISLMESVVTTTEEVVVTARKAGEVINEMALISARQFSVEETNRYPGSRSDPARMVSNFAGVAGGDDSRSDIIVRGNSPLGVVWRMEGIDLFNPSHFGTSGSSGGPTAILNNKMLGNSDFFMSAFPAEYGNSISAVFDLKTRNGNNQQYEFTGQLGVLGVEFLSEGPMDKKGNSSYLVMGRYSTLSILKSVGISIGTDATPGYFDGAFKFNWKLNKGGNLSLFALGGKSEINILISEQTEPSEDLYGEGDRDQNFGTSMVQGGINYKKPVSEKTFITTTLAYGHEQQWTLHSGLDRHLDTLNKGQANQSYRIVVDSIYPIMGYVFNHQKISYHFGLTHKFNARHTIKAGINADLYLVDQIDSVRSYVGANTFRYRYDYNGAMGLLRGYAQWKYRITERMDLTAGIHTSYFTYSNSYTPVEPRLGWKWRMKNNQSLAAGAGLHSQMQPLYIYTYNKFAQDGSKIYHLKDLDLTRSVHTSVAYEKSFKGNWNFKSEAYFQYLYNVPVTVAPSSYSLINMGSGFQRFFPDSLNNDGTGTNYGLELTLQKFFDKQFFFMVTATLFDSKYVGSDGIRRNTSYNGNYILNILGGKDFKIGERNTITLGLKMTYAGGKRYGYVDMARTLENEEIYFLDEGFNTRRFKDYFRLDLKLGWKLNKKRTTHEVGFDLVNVLNIKNVLMLSYAPNIANPTAEPIAIKNQLGFLPLIYYKIDFRIDKNKQK